MTLKSGLLSPSKLIISLFLIVSLSVATLSAPVRHAQQQQPTATRPFPPTQYVPDRDFDTRHIALDLRFDWDKEQLIGHETLVFAPLVNELKAIDLNAANITVTSAKLSSGTNLQFTTNAAKQTVTISLDRGYQINNELTLLIDYHTNGAVSSSLTGLTGVGLRFIKPTPNDPKRPKQIWSQGESEYNRYWFLSYDHPNDFFTSEISATVEKPLTVISNGRLIDTKENKDGTRTFHWKIDEPHASYLTSIVVGEYAAVVGDYAGIPVITNVYPGELEEGRVTAARLPEMVKFFSEKTGLKYPYAKYAQTVVRDFGGGMENISATTQTDNMIHDARTELDQTSDGLQSHELAHQWFGDYVTARSWSDIWLNESFATYFQAMWDEYKYGPDEFLYSDVKSNQDSYFSAWKQGNRRPIVTKNYANPDAVFDTYAYPRGGAVLHMLRKNLGEDNWWRAINYYLKKYAHQPVQTEQFRIAIEESTGQSMDWFFDEWVYRMGHPVFQVTQAYDDATKSLNLTVTQQQKTDPQSQYPQVSLFQTPVEIEIGTATGTRVERVRIEPKLEQSFTFKVDSKPLLVNFDYKGTLIKELEFKKTAEELKYQLENDEDVLGRLWALKEVSAQLKTASAESKTALVDQITRALAADKFWGLRYEAALALADVQGQPARDALIAATKDKKSRVRSRAIASLATSKDATLANLYQQFLNDDSYAVIRSAALALAQTKSPTAFDSLEKLLKSESWHDTIRASALNALVVVGDKRSLDSALKYAAVGNYPGVRAASIRLLGAVGKGDSRALQIISDELESSYKRADFALVAASSEALATLGDPRGLAVFERVTKDTNGPSPIKPIVVHFQEQLKKSSADAAKPAATNPG